MRLRAVLFVLTALGGVAAGAHRLAVATTDYVERKAAVQVAQGLAAAGEPWAEARADGLIVTLGGTAPDEARRLRAVEIARRLVDPRRIRDATALLAADPQAPPPFALELLRNEAEVSLIGLAPAGAGRGDIAAALAAGGLDDAVSDMLESVAHPAPPGWRAALGFALTALPDLPRAKISVTPGHVAVMALAETEGERAVIEDELRATLPAGVTLALSVTAPRPVIAPFALDFALEDGAPQLVACSAESPEDAAHIAAAAGLAATDCALGLGAPSPDWAEAVAAGIAAVRALGGGGFSLADREAMLTSPAGVAPERLEAVGAALAERLSPAFALSFAAPPQIAQDRAGGYAYAPRFDAALHADGSLQLTGPAHDPASRDAIASYAAALFGHERVLNAIVIDPHLPAGWPGRVLTGVEALALMKEGRLEVTPEAVSVEGWASEVDGAARAQALFAAKDIGTASIEVRFDAAAAVAEAEALAEAADPVGTCERAVAEVQEAETIAFQPGAATLEETGAAAVARFAAAFADCPPVDFEIAGHTDSQGSAEGNQRLSEARAAAVKAGLDAADLPHVRFTARGYGATRPVADNDTEEGRARNRRIAFTLIDEAAQQAAAEAGPDAAAQAEGDAVQAEGDAVQAEGDAVQAAGDAVQAESDAAQAEGDAVQAEGDAAQAEGDAAPAAGSAAPGPPQPATAAPAQVEAPPAPAIPEDGREPR